MNPITTDDDLIAARDAVADVRAALTGTEWKQENHHVFLLLDNAYIQALALEESLTLAVYWRAAGAKEEPKEDDGFLDQAVYESCIECGMRQHSKLCKLKKCGLCCMSECKCCPEYQSELADEHERRHGVGDAVEEPKYNGWSHLSRDFGDTTICGKTLAEIKTWCIRERNVTCPKCRTMLANVLSQEQ